MFVFSSTWNALQPPIYLENFYTAFKALSNVISSVKPSQTSSGLWEFREDLSVRGSQDGLGSSGLWLPLGAKGKRAHSAGPLSPLSLPDTHQPTAFFGVLVTRSWEVSALE